MVKQKNKLNKEKIICKAWWRKNKEMLSPDKIISILNNGTGITTYIKGHEIIPIKEIKILLYSGMNDDNNEKLFNSDIIEYSHSQTQHYKGIIYKEGPNWLIDCFWERIDPFKAVGGEGHEMIFKYMGTIHRLDPSNLFDVKKLGNKFEDIELYPKRLKGFG
ncbi:hypothetical protein LCGC14_2546250 [marine sediment metagenome]|uniref:YopX protein domain-containing protein n=1 Tax=marine sediment metagenome TaxID=412755 RepID=A0A0F9BC09_9ZZZZ